MHIQTRASQKLNLCWLKKTLPSRKQLGEMFRLADQTYVCYSNPLKTQIDKKDMQYLEKNSPTGTLSYGTCVFFTRFNCIGKHACQLIDCVHLSFLHVSPHWKHACQRSTRILRTSVFFTRFNRIGTCVSTRILRKPNPQCRLHIEKICWVQGMFHNFP
jgi:hypothetical protein